MLVWDLPTRAFHWMFAAAFAGAYVTGESERWLVAHALFGYTLLGLLAFRLLWGIVGTRHARFAAFVRGPRAVGRYLGSLLTAGPQHFTGHNPAGGWAIVALLVLAALSGASGWLALHDVGGKLLEELHEGISATMLAIVALHIGGAVVSSLAHRENLPRAMVTGYKLGYATDALRGSVWIVGIALVAAVGTFWVSALRGDLPAVTQPAVERQARETERREHRRRSDSGCQPASACAASSASRTAALTTSATPIDSTTDWSAVRAPSDRYITANVEMHGT